MEMVPKLVQILANQFFDKALAKRVHPDARPRIVNAVREQMLAKIAAAFVSQSDTQADTCNLHLGAS